MHAASMRALVAGEDPGPLAGVPVGVKNLYRRGGSRDACGLEDPPRQAATTAAVAVLVRRLKAAGAVLLGCQNMDEFAYGFTTENPHYGATHNPHDRTRSAGGSSGGSAAAVAAGMVAISLGSDTNGSIRVPASFCGIFGLKPTFGRLPRTGAYPFVYDLDHLGPFTRNVRDLALAYDVLQGYDGADAACADRVAEPALPGLDGGIDALRVGVLDDWFEYGASDEALDAVQRVAAAFATTQPVRLREARRARAAAYCLTAAAGAALYLEHHLQSRPQGTATRRATGLSAARCCRQRWCWLRRSACVAGSPQRPRQLFQQSRRAAGARDTGGCHGAWAEDPTAGGGAGSGTPQHRPLHPAPELHRSAGGGRAATERAEILPIGVQIDHARRGARPRRCWPPRAWSVRTSLQRQCIQHDHQRCGNPGRGGGGLRTVRTCPDGQRCDRALTRCSGIPRTPFVTKSGESLHGIDAIAGVRVVTGLADLRRLRSATYDHYHLRH